MYFFCLSLRSFPLLLSTCRPTEPPARPWTWTLGARAQTAAPSGPPTSTVKVGSYSQSRQSAKRSPIVGIGTPPTPSPANECAPPPLDGGEGAYSLAGEGVGESQLRRQTHTLWCSIYVSPLWFLLQVTSIVAVRWFSLPFLGYRSDIFG
jgi:hypothetical protein